MIRYKSAYFAQRNPALAEPFRTRWRQHAALAMGLPLWSGVGRYAQYDPVRDPPAALGVSARYDAIGISWSVDAEAFKGLRRGGGGMDVMRRDELEVFHAAVKEVAFRCAETELKDDGAGQFKVFSSVNRAPGVAPAAFAEALIGAFAGDILAHPDLGPRLARLAVCLPSGLTPAGEGRQQDGLEEYSFHTLDAAAAVFASGAYRKIAEDYRPTLTEWERCATRELMLYDRSADD